MLRIPRCLPLLLVALAILAAPAVQAAETLTDEQIERTIKTLQEAIWADFDGDHVRGDEPSPPYESGKGWGAYIGGGKTALAAWALLESGVSPNEPRMKAVLKWLDEIPMVGTYALSLRVCVFASVSGREYRTRLLRDVRQLGESISREGQYAGGYSYPAIGQPTGEGFDNSNSQFAVLGMWLAAKADVEIPGKFWELVVNHWRSTQTSDGGWSYGAGGRAYGSMSTAGLASMFVAVDQLGGREFLSCGKNPDIPAIRDGLKWMERNFSPSENPFMPPADAWKATMPYYLFCCERVGLASGYKYFGEHDWFAEGGRHLMNNMPTDVVARSFTLLFFVRGRRPIIANRLEYDGDWNNRPRALANLAEYIGKTFERPVNWQILGIDSNVDEWHDAPILTISGSRPVSFTDAQLDKLRTFVLQGGTILSVAECLPRGLAFDRTMREVYQKLFPQYKLEALPLTHPAYSVHFKVRRNMRLFGVSNGVRLLAVHTTFDLNRAYQANQKLRSQAEFELAANLFFFATDKLSLRNRMVHHWPKPTGGADGPAIKIARLMHDGNYDPEPLALERMRIELGNDQLARLTVSEPMKIADLKASDWPVATLTSASAFALTEDQRAALGRYIDDGGTLICDAAGGDADAQKAMEAMLQATFAQSPMRIAASAPLYEMPGHEIKTVAYRRAMAEALSTDARQRPRLAAIEVKGRLAVFYSAEDLQAGMVGYSTFGLKGYEPASARAIVRNILLYVAGK